MTDYKPFYKVVPRAKLSRTEWFIIFVVCPSLIVLIITGVIAGIRHFI